MTEPTSYSVSLPEDYREAIGQAIGAASMCWTPRPSDAVFDSESALAIADALIARFDRMAESRDNAHNETPDDAELRRLAEAAAPGPWKWEPPSEDDWPEDDEPLVSLTADTRVIGSWGHDGWGTEATDDDRAYIAAVSPDVVLNLLARLARGQQHVGHPAGGTWCGATNDPGVVDIRPRVPVCAACHMKAMHYRADDGRKQRGRAVRAEMERDALAAAVARVRELADRVDRHTEVESDPVQFRDADTGGWWEVSDALRAALDGGQR